MFFKSGLMWLFMKDMNFHLQISAVSEHGQLNLILQIKLPFLPFEETREFLANISAYS